MAGGNVAITITSEGLAGITEQVNLSVNLTAPVGVVSALTVSSSPVLLPVPANVSYLLIVPPTGNTTALFLGGSVFANMASISPVNPTLVAMPTVPNIYLAAQASVSGITLAYY